MKNPFVLLKRLDLSQLKKYGIKQKQIERTYGMNSMQCYFCHKNVRYQSELNRHLSIHTKEGHRKCHQCKLKLHYLTSSYSLYIHQVKVHGRPTFDCPTCGKQSRTEVENKRHMRIHIQWTCSYPNCSKSFVYKSKLTEHLRKVHKTQAVKCHLCLKSLSSKHTLEAHILSVHEKVKTHKCKLCPKLFFSRYVLAAHIRSHTGERDLRTCKVDGCGRIFNSYNLLRKHHKQVHEEKRKESYQCPHPHCPKIYEKKESLNSHITRTHLKHRPVACGLCGESFISKTLLRDHVAAFHTGERAYSCDRVGCGKTFKTSTHYNGHIRDHKWEETGRKFTCTKCPEKFDSRKMIQLHRRRNHNETNCTCYFCGKVYNNLEKMTNHMQLHHIMERPYICEYEGCRAEFIRAQALGFHKDVKHGRIPPCYFCQKRFDKSHIPRHLFIHTTEKPYRCGICKRGFSAVDRVRRHFAVHRNKNKSNFKENFQRYLEIVSGAKTKSAGGNGAWNLAMR